MTMASTRKPALRAVNSQVPVYQLHIELKYLKPAVWRRVLVPASIKLPKLHVVLLLAMGWDGGHMHEFMFGDTNYGVPDPDFPSDPPMLNEARASLGKALGALKSFTYIYDYGDNWQHRVKVEKVLPPDPELRSPICLDGRNACPPEDVGGVPGYIEFLDAIIDPAHEEHQRLLDWCGGSFDPAAFDLQDLNERLFEIKF
jgi:Plasmid pRiA4b ORF-3-like protein